MIRNSLLSCLLSCCFLIQVLGQNLTFSPEKPSPGEKITITYDANETPLKDVKSLDGVAIVFKVEESKAVELDLKKKGDNHYMAQIDLDKEVLAVFVYFMDEENGIRDNNQDQGYYTKIYTADKSAVVKGGYLALAGGFYRNAYYTGIPRDADKAMKYIKKEMNKYPENGKDIDFLNAYLNVAARTKDEASLAELKTIAEEFGKQKKSEKKMTFAYQTFTVLEEKEIAENIEKKILKKFPNGDYAKNSLVNQFYENRGNLDKQEELLNSFTRLVDPTKEGDVNDVDYMASSMAMSFAKKGKWEKYEKYMGMVNNESDMANMYNSLAWNLSGGSIEAEVKADQLEKAFSLSKKSIDLVQENIKNYKQTNPAMITPKDWKKRQEMMYGMFADTYALLAYKKGNSSDALKYQQVAVDANGGPDYYERYVIYFEEEKGSEATEELLAKLIQEGKGTSKMEARHKELFLTNNDLEQAYGKYMDLLMVEANKKLEKKMEKKMIDLEAPDFVLKDLDGKDVKLSDLKGKVVILDFWATWCGPCTASFPGMQKALNKFSEKYNTAFLFIDTWENEEDKEKNASDFIKKNNYTFQVLMDNDNKVVANYKVEGIPTKFIIDPSGKIRFKSVGFSGSDTKLVKELELMIKMAKAKAEEEPSSVGRE